MAIPKKILKLVQARDQHCWHCGTDDDTLVPHHRKNKGFGGSKLLDTPDNLMMICAYWNGTIESNADDASAARGWGHKLPNWDATHKPVFDKGSQAWFILSADGTKVKLEDDLS